MGAVIEAVGWMMVGAMIGAFGVALCRASARADAHYEGEGGS